MRGELELHRDKKPLLKDDARVPGEEKGRIILDLMGLQ
jgi:hypothetical protein